MAKALTGLKIKGHIGTWYMIDEMETEKHGTVYLLEHEEYGDEAACLIVDKDLNVILDDVWNGFGDLDLLDDTDTPLQTVINRLMANDRNASWDECETLEEVAEGLRDAMEGYEESEETYQFYAEILSEIEGTVQ